MKSVKSEEGTLTQWAKSVAEGPSDDSMSPCAGASC